jgi:hypothetical protein
VEGKKVTRKLLFEKSFFRKVTFSPLPELKPRTEFKLKDYARCRSF